MSHAADKPAVKQLLNPEEARVEVFNGQIGRDALYRLLSEGKIPHLRVGKKYLIPRAALERWIEEQTVKAG